MILAGGRGSRMGGVDKGWVVYRGRPLVVWVREAVLPQVDTLVISANRSLDAYAALGHRVLPDSLPGYPGPLAGMLTAMRAVAEPWLLVVPCDVPHLPADLASRLHAAATAAGAPLAVAADGARTHPTCCLVRTTLADDLQAFLATGERAVWRWQARHAPAVADFPEGGFANVNTPDAV